MKDASLHHFRTRLTLLAVWMLLVPLSWGVTGCAIGPRIVTEYDSNTFAHNPQHQKVLWTYAWGLVQPKDFNPGCDVGFNHLNRVDVKTNIGFIMLSAITLGVVVPVEVKWDCAPPPVTPGDLGTDH